MSKTTLRLLEVLTNCSNIHFARLIEGVKRTSVDVHDISLAGGTSDVFGYDVSPANAYCRGTGKRMPRIRSVARTVSSRRPIGGRAMGLVNGHESFLALRNHVLSQSWTPASSLVSGKP